MEPTSRRQFLRRSTAVAAAAGAVIEVDLCDVREFHDFAVAVLGQALGTTRARVKVRGLRQHHIRVLRYFGVDAGPTERAVVADLA